MGRNTHRIGTGGPGFGVAFADLDSFGRFNKRYGQKVANDALRRFVRTTKKRLRSRDRLFRLHGDEFAALIETTDSGTLAGILERLRLPISVPLPRGRSENLTASFVGLIARQRDLGTILEVLDRRLRAQKRVTHASRQRLARRSTLPHAKEKRKTWVHEAGLRSIRI